MKYILKLLAMLFFSTNLIAQSNAELITDDINNFWNAYDKVVSTKDSIMQYQYLQKLYLDKASPGLLDLVKANHYTAKSYLDAIEQYPLFWKSVRLKTQEYKNLRLELDAQLVKFGRLYPSLKPRRVYFAIGALRGAGVVINKRITIASEIELADSSVVSFEFPESMERFRHAYFETNPRDNFVASCVSQYISTQENYPIDDLLTYCVWVGVAEFITVKVTGKPSAIPAIAFGEKNKLLVRKKFEEDIFNPVKTSQWLWGIPSKEFNVKDLGYYIGYAICENYYHKSGNKKITIKELIELNYYDQKSLEKMVDASDYFSVPLKQLHDKFDKQVLREKTIQ